MELPFNELLEKAKKDRKAFKALKDLVVKCQMYEFAAELRSMEHELFPQTEEQKQAQALGRNFQTLLGMLDLNAQEHSSWLILKAAELYKEKGSLASLNDTADLKAACKRLFEIDSI